MALGKVQVDKVDWTLRWWHVSENAKEPGLAQTHLGTASGTESHSIKGFGHNGNVFLLYFNFLFTFIYYRQHMVYCRETGQERKRGDDVICIYDTPLLNRATMPIVCVVTNIIGPLIDLPSKSSLC